MIVAFKYRLVWQLHCCDLKPSCGLATINGDILDMFPLLVCLDVLHEAALLTCGCMISCHPQVMSSGLTESTAKHGNTPCQGSYLEDLVGLRPLGRCSYVPQPAFGMIEVDWAGNKVHLQIRNGSSGAVAYGIDGRRQEVVLSLDTCAPVA